MFRICLIGGEVRSRHAAQAVLNGVLAPPMGHGNQLFFTQAASVPF
jgi:hypothetical protein